MPGTTGRLRFGDLSVLGRSAEAAPDVQLDVWTASDEALVAGLAGGDRDAALVLVRRFQARVFGLALSITRDRGVAEEAAQDTFLKAWRYAASYDPRRGPVAGWLLGIARNAALDLARARGRRLDRLGLDPGDILADVAGSDDVNSPHDVLDPLAGAVRSLPDDQRDVLMAAVYHGFTAREISEAWNLPIGTVKTRLRLALGKLRDLARRGRAVTRLRCAELVDLAPELAVGNLCGEERAAAIAHLAGCTACQQEVNELVSVTDRLLLLGPRVEPPAGFEERVLAALPSRRAQRAPTPGPRRWAPLLAAAAVALTLVGGGWLIDLRVSGEPALAGAEMRTATGEIVGEVFLHRDEPGTLFMTLPGWAEQIERYGPSSPLRDAHRDQRRRRHHPARHSRRPRVVGHDTGCRS